MKQKDIDEVVQRFYEMTNPFHGMTLEEYNKCLNFLVDELKKAHYLGQKLMSDE